MERDAPRPTLARWIEVAALYVGCLLTRPGWAAAGGVAVLGAVVLLGRGLSRPLRLLAVAGALALLGSGLAGVQAALLERGPLMELARAGGQAEVVATVAGEPEGAEGGSVTVRVTRVDSRRTRTRGLLRLDGQPAPPIGTPLRARVTARPLQEEGYEAWLRQRHIALALDPVGPLEVTGRPGALWTSTTRVRARLRRAAVAVLPPSQAALLVGLVIGDESLQSDRQREQLRAGGLSHLTAVSGSNVALVAGGALAAAGSVGLGFRRRWLLVGAAVAWFVVLVRFEPSVLRAATMTGLVVAARISGRGLETRYVLPAAVLLLLLVDPLLAGQLGFALSVAATAGVLLVAPWMEHRLRGPPGPRRLLAASVGAQLGVAPVLFVAGEGPAWSWLSANVLAVPAAAVASLVGVAAALLAQLSVAVAGLVAALAWPALALIGFAARLGAPPAGSAALLVLLGVGVVVWPWRGRPLVLVAGLAGLAVLHWLPGGAAPPAGLRLVALDVGQGDALLVEVPADGGHPGATMLVDAGPQSGDVVAHLRQRGVAGLDALALTHPHADHDEGLDEVLREVRVGTLLLTEAARADAGTRTLRREAAREGVDVVEADAGQRFALGAATVRVLGPARSEATDELNDTSLVLQVTSADGTLLLTGDIEEQAQRRLLGDPTLSSTNVLKVPHHGGDTNAASFFEAVDPEVAVISVGDDNEYGHPSPRVLAALGDVPVWRTDRHGTVEVTLSDGEVSVQPARR